MKLALVGAGWRAAFYYRAAQAIDGLEICCVVEKNAKTAAWVKKTWKISVVDNVEEALKYHPDFFVLCLPPKALPEMICRLIQYDMPILSETWASDSVEEMISLYNIAKGKRVMVSEQYAYQPMHSARLEVIHSGILGEVCHVQISVAHGYHGIALMRKYLGVGFQECIVEGRSFSMNTFEGPGRQGWPDMQRLHEEKQELIVFGYKDKWAILDFTEEQYFSPLRCSRVLVRGEKGEIEQEKVSYLTDNYPECIRFSLQRDYSGWNNSLGRTGTIAITGNGRFYYRNIFGAKGLSDEETAVATSLYQMVRYIETGKGSYLLEEELQDQYLTYIAWEAIRTGRKIRSRKMPWGHEKEDKYGG